MKKIILLIFLFSSFNSFCQIPTGGSGGVVTGGNINFLQGISVSISDLDSNSKSKRTTRYENIEGTPYIDNYSGANNNLPIGKFYTSDFKYIDTAFARYNAYTDEMEVSMMDDGVDYYLLNKKPDFLYIVLKKKTYRSYNYKNTMSYFVIMSETDKEKCTFLKREKIVFKKGENPESSFLVKTPDSFRKVRDVLFFKFDTVIKEIPKKKKLFYNLFDKKKEEIKSYITSNRLKITKEEDLLVISNYYNSLY